MIFLYPDLYLIKSVYKKGDKGDTGSNGSAISILANDYVNTANTTNNSWETEHSFTLNIGTTPLSIGDLISYESRVIYSTSMANIRHKINGTSPDTTIYNNRYSTTLNAFSLPYANLFNSFSKFITEISIISNTTLHITQYLITSDYGAIIMADYHALFSVSDISSNNIVLTFDVYAPTGTITSVANVVSLMKKI